MKPYAQFALTLAVLAAAWWLGSLAGVPFFVTMAAMFFVINQLIFEFNSRAMLRLRPVPASGYEGRRRALELGAGQLADLGFAKVDEFYLKSFSDAVVYVYRHRQEPVYLCAYHLGVKGFCDLITKFEDDITLTTTTCASVGAAPRPARRLAQVFVEDPGYGPLFEAHRRGAAYLAQHSIRAAEPPPFREFFLKSMREYEEAGRGQRFFILKFVGRLAASAGKNYRMPLERQYPAGLPAEVLTG